MKETICTATVYYAEFTYLQLRTAPRTKIELRPWSFQLQRAKPLTPEQEQCPSILLKASPETPFSSLRGSIYDYPEAKSCLRAWLSVRKSLNAVTKCICYGTNCPLFLAAWTMGAKPLPRLPQRHRIVASQAAGWLGSTERGTRLHSYGLQLQLHRGRMLD